MRGLAGRRKLLRIFISLEDKFEGKPLWEYILQLVKENGLAGATVFKAVAGIGSHSELKTFSVWRLSQNLPVVVEIIDREEKIREFLKVVDSIIEEGLVVLEDVEVISYRHRRG
jgi:PII-like signaling protein